MMIDGEDEVRLTFKHLFVAVEFIQTQLDEEENTIQSIQQM